MKQNENSAPKLDLDMETPEYRITALSPSASLNDALRTHWREYLMEATELAVFMVGVCAAGTLLYGAGSPLNTLGVSLSIRPFLMGVAVAATSFLITRSAFGRRTGAHFNPALTMSYFSVGRIHRWDALFYIVAQFIGGIFGVFISHRILGMSLADFPVHYMVTLPGSYGIPVAFIAEFVASFLLMMVILVVTNQRKLARFSPMFVATVTIFYFVFCRSISGYSVNPARSFSSALFANIWQGLWLYFLAPGFGMVTAAIAYKNIWGADRIYCAKVFHDHHSTCPFHCRFEELLAPDPGFHAP